MGFLQNLEASTIVWLAIGVLILAGVLIVAGRLGRLLSLGIKGVVAGVAIWGINLLMGLAGVGLALPGVNFLTIAIVAVLGLPGLLTIYGVMLIGL